MTQQEASQFRRVCEHAGLAVTHQRQVIYEVLTATDGHPSPEEVYARVKRRIPSISLATVYKNIHLFIESGIFHQVSLHHGSMRVETNHTAHHHLVCTECKSISDIDADTLGLGGVEHRLVGGFLVQRLAVGRAWVVRGLPEAGIAVGRSLNYFIAAVVVRCLPEVAFLDPFAPARIRSNPSL